MPQAVKPSPALCSPRAWPSFGRRGTALRVVIARRACGLQPWSPTRHSLTAPYPPWPSLLVTVGGGVGGRRPSCLP